MKKEKIIVRCRLCGCEKRYKSKNPYPCPVRKTHAWYMIRESDEEDD